MCVRAWPFALERRKACASRRDTDTSSAEAGQRRLHLFEVATQLAMFRVKPALGATRVQLEVERPPAVGEGKAMHWEGSALRALPLAVNRKQVRTIAHAHLARLAAR